MLRGIQPVFLLYLLTVISVGNTFDLRDTFENLDTERSTDCNMCAESEDCSSTNNVCLDGECECDYGYRRDGDTCIEDTLGSGKLGGSCSEMKSCEPPNSQCFEDKCVCHHLSVRVYDECLPEKNHNETCQHRAQCPDFQYCSCDGRCACITNYVFEEFVWQSCLPVSGRDGPCKVTAQCVYANAECNNGVCGCAEGMGRSLDNPECVAKTMEFSVSMELTNVPYTPRLSDPRYQKLVVDVDNILKTITFSIERSGIKVETLTVHGFTKNPNSGKANMTLSLNVFNPEYQRIRQGGMRGKRSIPDVFISPSHHKPAVKATKQRESYRTTADITADRMQRTIMKAIAIQR